MKEHRFTREAFYELVWSKPAIKLAPELGISDAAITKICRRYRIPKPGVGDWNLLAAGYKIKKPRLPALKDGERNEIVIWPTDKHDQPAPLQLPADILQLIEKKKLPENRISVTDQRELAHPILRRSQQLLKKADTDIYGRLTLPLYKSERLPIGLAVSANSLNRSLKLIDALFKAIVQRGQNVKAIDNHLHVIIKGERISLHLKERTTQKLVRDHERSQYSYQKYRYIPNGNLTLSLTSEAEGTKHTWSDKLDQPLEDQLNDIYIGMLTHAALSPASRAAKLERERMREQRWREAELHRLAEQNRRQVFKRRKESLDLQLEAWITSCNLRLFLTQCEARLKEKGELDPTSVEGQWLDWSRAYADSFDPTKNGQLQILASQFDEPKFY